MKNSPLFNSFFDSEKAGGLVLLFCTAASLLLANSSISGAYLSMWHTPIGSQSIEYWINDGLMAIFFLLIGLELEREVYIGELSKIKDAILPLSGALGGMLIPALFYFAFNFGTATQHGIGIPMATDIAFAIGILSLLGNKVPLSLKIFLTALAVIDDLGAETGFIGTDKTASGFTQRILYSLMNKRQDKSTIITTNLNSAQITAMYDSKIISRLYRRLGSNVIKFESMNDRRMSF